MGGIVVIDVEKIEQLIEERKQIPVYDDISALSKAEDIFLALGDDEDEVYKYLKSLDWETFDWMTECYEEISAKFDSDRIEELFHNHNHN